MALIFCDGFDHSIEGVRKKWDYCANAPAVEINNSTKRIETSSLDLWAKDLSLTLYCEVA